MAYLEDLKFGNSQLNNRQHNGLDYTLQTPSTILQLKPPLVGAFAMTLLAAVILAVLLLAPIPIKGRATSYLMDLVHAPAFAVLAMLACKAAAGRLPHSLFGKLFLVALPLAACGLGAEYVQSFVGRGASWHDARANLLGACAGVCWYQFWRASQSTWGWLLGLAVVGLFTLASAMPIAMLGDCWRQMQQFPRFASFENPLEEYRFVAQEAEFQRVPNFATEGQWGLEILLLPGKYPGILLGGMPSDWSAYQTLAFDLYVDNGLPLDLIVKVHDREHRAHDFAGDDRYDGHFRLEPGWHKIRIPLAEIRTAPRTREMNMRDIEGWQLFTYDLAEPRTIVLDDLRLE